MYIVLLLYRSQKYTLRACILANAKPLIEDTSLALFLHSHQNMMNTYYNTMTAGDDLPTEPVGKGYC